MESRNVERGDAAIGHPGDMEFSTFYFVVRKDRLQEVRQERQRHDLRRARRATRKSASTTSAITAGFRPALWACAAFAVLAAVSAAGITSRNAMHPETADLPIAAQGVGR